MSAARGNCPECGRRVRLRKDGTVMTHSYVTVWPTVPSIRYCPSDRAWSVSFTGRAAPTKEDTDE